MTKISIIIVSWNVGDYLEKCIHSIFEFYKNDNIEIIVIDNASTDGTRDWLRAQGSGLRAIINGKNVGFAHACNQGIRIASGEYILLLNPDTIIHEGVLESMVDFFETHDDCGIAGCKLFNKDSGTQPSVRRFPKLFSQITILLKLHHIFPSIPALKNYFAIDFDYNKTQEVDQVMGAFFIFPKKIIEKIGMLDEKFFIWFEEVDFCKRVKNAGLKVCYFADASIVHYGGESFKQKLSYEKQKIFNASCIYYFNKHGTWFEVAILKIINPISVFLAWVQEL